MRVQRGAKEAGKNPETVVFSTDHGRSRRVPAPRGRRGHLPPALGYLSATSLASDCLLAVTAVLRLQQLAEGVSVELSLAEDRGERPSGQRAVHGHDHGATVCVAQLRVRAALADILESRPA